MRVEDPSLNSELNIAELWIVDELWVDSAGDGFCRRWRRGAGRGGGCQVCVPAHFQRAVATEADGEDVGKNEDGALVFACLWITVYLLYIGSPYKYCQITTFIKYRSKIYLYR